MAGPDRSARQDRKERRCGSLLLLCAALLIALPVGVSHAQSRQRLLSGAIRASAGNCPSSWTFGDVGHPAKPGSQSAHIGTFSITSESQDIYGASDQFHYVWKKTPVDTQLTARIVSQGASDGTAKAGLMLRTGTSASAPHYATLEEPTGNVRKQGAVFVQWRAPGGAFAYDQTYVASGAPIYLELTRQGTSFSALTSRDGKTWKLVPGSMMTLAVKGALWGGFAVTSHSTTTASTAVFDHIHVSG